MFTKKTETPTETPTKKKSPMKIALLALGAIVGVSHIGLLGYVVNNERHPQVPVINIPRGDYSSYRIKAGRDGYEIEYKANDPAILRSEKSYN